MKKIFDQKFQNRQYHCHDREGEDDDGSGVVFDGAAQREIGHNDDEAEKEGFEHQVVFMPKVVTSCVDTLVRENGKNRDIDGYEGEIVCQRHRVFDGKVGVESVA